SPRDYTMQMSTTVDYIYTFISFDAILLIMMSIKHFYSSFEPPVFCFRNMLHSNTHTHTQSHSRKAPPGDCSLGLTHKGREQQLWSYQRCDKIGRASWSAR